MSLRKTIAFAVVLLCGYLTIYRSRATHQARPATGPASSSPNTTAVVPAAPVAPPSADDPSIARAIANHAHEVTVDASGVVSRVLPDDREGERHQRFIVRLPSGTTVLIAHNIDIAPRVEGLRAGAPIVFEGEYVWNAQGGVVHWTHHDPSGRHRSGFVKYNGRTYE